MPSQRSSIRSKTTAMASIDGLLSDGNSRLQQVEQHPSARKVDHGSEASDSNDDDGSLETDGDDEFAGSSAADGDEVAKAIETESKHHRNWRIVVVSVLLLIGAGLSVLAFQSLVTLERSEIDQQFQALVVSLNGRANDHTQSIMQSLERLGDQFEREALLVAKKQTNFVTLPRFEYAGRDVLENGLQVVSYAPIIEMRDSGNEWANYSMANDLWIEESFELADLESPADTSTTPYIWFGKDVDGTSIPSIFRPTPFVPLWQTSPPPATRDVVNQDMHASDFFPPLLDALLSGDSFVISGMENTSAIWNDMVDGGSHAVLLYPIHDKSAASSKKVMSALISSLSWDLFMSALVSSGAAEGVNFALKNTCGQSYYYMDGEKTGVIGDDNLQQTSDLARLTGTFPLFGDGVKHSTGRGCVYSVQLFASYSSFSNSKGANLMPLILFVMFVALSFFYVLYDKFLEGRIAKVAEKAARSNALVSSLFPTQVHDRLFQKDEGSEAQSKRSKQSGRRNVKQKTMHEMEAHVEEDDSGEMFRTRPIADLFPVATLLFADLAGFTAWSSARQPTEVFTLLETLYRNFDTIAKKRGIFKVETVGDCYVAACGLPEPRKDHCVAMCRFARDILSKTKELVRKLESILGPDTSDLHLRIGIHSGPVTGGVLRGEKSRFQLFGDSMNTCARIETTGMKGRIHLSQETADLLVAAGKVNWFYSREEKVFAKGKGELNTFWLKSGATRQKASRKGGDRDRDEDTSRQDLSSCDVTEDEADDDSDSDTDSDNSDSDMETEKLLHDLVSPKTARLVEFNTEVLIRFLKMIKRKRMATATRTVKNQMNHIDIIFPSPHCAQEAPLSFQVKDVISMPKFDPIISAIPLDNGSTDDVTLDQEVIQELHDFVTNVAIMHNSKLTFHCFDHASHVMLSVTKFLSRMTIGKSTPGRRFDNLIDGASELHERTHGLSSCPLTQFACVFSALIHDIDHPGVPNDVLVKENAELADAYQGVSVAEQNSFDLAWGLLTDEQYPALRAAIFETAEEMERFRSLVMNCVLSTDVSDDTVRDARNKRWTSAFGEDASREFDNGDRKATLIMEYVVRASDVIHAMQHWHIYRQWTGRQFTELYRAFKRGRITEDPSSGFYEKEIAFFDKCIIPTAEKLVQCDVFGVASKEAYSYATQNRLEWVTCGREIVQEMVAACNKGRESTFTASPIKALNANMPLQAAKVAELMQQVHRLELEEKRLRNESPSST
ncbi:hypothetical protein MPSEU_000128400 [Mayamaea pseudoterrestris]|nr:hypothetical protein MPSEU_000128400 [Mayamaea pseudoterrestris]